MISALDSVSTAITLWFILFIVGNGIVYLFYQKRTTELRSQIILLETELRHANQEALRLQVELKSAELRIQALERSVVDLAAAKARITELERQLGRRNGGIARQNRKQYRNLELRQRMLAEQLEIYEKQLAQLELQIAQQGGNLAPYPLLTQADELREHIKGIQVELDMVQKEMIQLSRGNPNLTDKRE